MTTHSRETKVLVVLGVSITLGAIILNALGHNPPSAGAFCLSRYYRLGSVKKSILSRADQSPGRWSQIEIYVSVPELGNIESAFGGLSDVGGDERINPVREQNEKVSNGVNCHFVICNGRVGHDGQIEPTEKWQRQSPVLALVGAKPAVARRPSRDRSVIPRENWNGEPLPPATSGGVLSDRSKYQRPTDFCETPTDQTIYICVIADDEAAPPTDFQIKRTEALVEVLCRKFDIQPDSIRYSDDWR